MEMSPQFFITRRRGMLALWVDVHGVGERSIWDLPEKEVTPEVLRALQSAFARGVEAATNDECIVLYDDQSTGWERRLSIGEDLNLFDSSNKEIAMMNDVAQMTIGTHAVTVSMERDRGDDAPCVLVSIWLDCDDEREVNLRMQPVMASAFVGALTAALRAQTRYLESGLAADIERAGESLGDSVYQARELNADA